MREGLRDTVSEDKLRELATVAEELARLAGAEIVTGLGRILTVRYKGESDESQQWRDPVSEVDSHIEQLVRARLAERFPGHDVLGEESEHRPRRGSEFVWAIDPIDGTTNFVNGFPCFASSIGVLHRGRPIAGALWCAATHALRPGVYHAFQGGPLCFDDEPIKRTHNSSIRRRLAGMPGLGVHESLGWDARKTGSAAVECAFAAAGLLQVALFARPNVWDVAGGVVLVEAAGGEVRTLGAEGWEKLTSFVPVGAEGVQPDIRGWRQPVIVGDTWAVELFSEAYRKSELAA